MPALLMPEPTVGDSPGGQHQPTIGDMIKQRRKAAGIRQAELADLLGVARATVINYEKNVSHPTGQTIQQIATAIGCEPGDLFPPTRPMGKRK